ncbi:hypothetical protein K504DRAFT_537911 [Pleomassaria siparia CBS 279.74]|uniref:Heterokaryon incompatibility domain-containing protein n=1 Tax=Pleomassaria siparia CBS 279.74 TaxID=1314801 RepID=A0A6G1JW63_9PLEO|nr:hypothetical protein K504DRAFT_537911 [Pleomassaria siparia CBS 279.74]
MAELCTACSQFIFKMSSMPKAVYYGSEDFATCSQIESAALTCIFCKVFWDSIQRMPTDTDFNVTLQIHWFVFKPGPTFVMLGVSASEDQPDKLHMVRLLGAESTPSNMPLQQRYLISYQKSKKPLQLLYYSGIYLSCAFRCKYFYGHLCNLLEYVKEEICLSKRFLENSEDGGLDTDITNRLPIWKPGLLNMNTRFKFVDNCCSNCIRYHAVCRKRLAGYPSRLLDLQGFENGRICLVNTTSFPTPLPEYFTLSHCWGKDQLLKTTQDTLPKHQQGVPVSDLPRTYLDAVKVARPSTPRSAVSVDRFIVHNSRLERGLGAGG